MADPATKEIRDFMVTENPKPAKVAAVAELKEKLEAADAVVATEYRGLDVPQQAALRAAISGAGGELKIYKNSLARIAANDLGLDMDDLLTGPTALAFTKPGSDDAPADPVALTKALQDFADENEAFVIKGGFMDGDTIGVDDVKALSKVPPREVMLSKLAGLFQAPMSNLASLFQAAPQQLAGLIKSLIEEKGGEAPVAAADGDAAEGGEEAAADEATESAAPAAEEGGDAAEASADADAGDAPAEEAADEAAAEADAEAPAEEAAAEATEDAGDSGDASEESTEEEA